MDVREKLVELIANAKRSMWGKNGLSCELARNMYLAENLIAHGVTVQEWISVDDRLPPADTAVLLFARWYVEIGWYDGNNDEWKTGITTFDNCGVTHWMPLPQPPKGE